MSVLKIPTAKVFEPLLQPVRCKALFGGRGSGKSHFFGELLVETCQAERGTLAVCIREAQRTLAQSSKRLIESKIASLGLGHGFKLFNDKIATPGDGLIIFRGMQDDVADTLADLHRLTFFESAPIPEFDLGNWWLAFYERVPVAFAGLIPSTIVPDTGYFCRVGVVDEHYGHSLQLRLMRAMESRARCNGWRCIVSDTTDNIVSANNFIRAGYRLYQPQIPWGWPNTLYWKKTIQRKIRRRNHNDA